jgi:hypothetical protein
MIVGRRCSYKRSVSTWLRGVRGARGEGITGSCDRATWLRGVSAAGFKVEEKLYHLGAQSDKWTRGEVGDINGMLSCLGILKLELRQPEAWG